MVPCGGATTLIQHEEEDERETLACEQGKEEGFHDGEGLHPW